MMTERAARKPWRKLSSEIKLPFSARASAGERAWLSPPDTLGASGRSSAQDDPMIQAAVPAARAKPPDPLSGNLHIS